MGEALLSLCRCKDKIGKLCTACRDFVLYLRMVNVFSLPYCSEKANNTRKCYCVTRYLYYNQHVEFVYLYSQAIHDCKPPWKNTASNTWMWKCVHIYIQGYFISFADSPAWHTQTTVARTSLPPADSSPYYREPTPVCYSFRVESDEVAHTCAVLHLQMED